MKIKVLNILLIVIAFLLTCTAIAWGAYFRTGFTLEQGGVSNVMIKAPRAVMDVIATERNRQEAAARAANMPAVKTTDPAVQLQVINNIDDLYSKLVGIRQSYNDEITARREAEEERLRLEEEKRLEEEERLRLEEELLAPRETGESGPAVSPELAPQPAPEPAETPAPSETPEEPWESLELFSSLNIIFTENQKSYLVTCGDDVLLAVFDSAKDVAAAALEQGVPVTEGNILDNKTVLDVQEDFKNIALDGEASDIGIEIVTEYLTSNEVINAEETQTQRDKIAADYEQVWLMQNQTIVAEGELITQEAYAIIEQLGMLDTGLEGKIIPMAGVFILIGLIFAACGIYLYTFNKSMGQHRKETLLLLTLYAIELAVMWLLKDFDYYVLPLLVFPMLVSILIDIRASFILSLGVFVVGFFIVNGSAEYLLFYISAGAIISLLSKYTTERNKIFLVGFLIALINFVLSCAVSFIVEKNQTLQIPYTILADAAFTALNGMLTVILCIGTLPFWETFFGVVTPVKLLDLTNPTNPLLRRLTIEAPGTYHHSLIVANLAETAAYDIGANPHTARAGGYYHDIGKLKYPQYFAENLTGENPHDHMDPFNSVQLIVSHVAYGLTLAAEYRLPQFMRDIISEHHGTTLIQYFYVRAKEENPEGSVSEKDFRYPYTVPQTRESACVMLADTIEAAVRAMIPHVKSVNEVENKINSLIRGKLNDGQLADSQLSIRDVSVIEKSFFRVLKGMYHERIPYPKLEGKEEE